MSPAFLYGPCQCLWPLSPAPVSRSCIQCLFSDLASSLLYNVSISRYFAQSPDLVNGFFLRLMYLSSAFGSYIRSCLLLRSMAPVSESYIRFLSPATFSESCLRSTAPVFGSSTLYLSQPKYIFFLKSRYSDYRGITASVANSHHGGVTNYALTGFSSDFII